MDSELQKDPVFSPSSMEERRGFKRPPGDPLTGRLDSEEGVRSKTSTRIFYEAQVEVIKKQLGDLEKIRLNLGLSQRKMAQLLMVDPSAWTRWNRENEEAPPHIWRALQWYMALNEKIPGLTPQYFVGKDPQILHEKALQRIDLEKSQRQHLEIDVEALKRTQKEVHDKLVQDLYFHRRLSYVFGALSIGLMIFIFSQFLMKP